MGRLLQDTGIMKKILAMMLLLGLVSVLLAAVNAWQMRNMDARYSDLVESQMPATTLMVRSNRVAAEIVKHGFRATTYGAGSAAAVKAAADIEKSFEEVEGMLVEAVRLDPEVANSVADIRRKLEQVHELTNQAVAQSQAGDRAGAVGTLGRADRSLSRSARG